jgi:DNA-binding response OmpR family regulator
MRILVVEDEKKIARFVQRGLKECGFVVDVLYRGDEALDVILTHYFDAVVLDIMLPGQDGLRVLRALRENSNFVPVLLLTARGDVAEKVEGLDLGADDYLAKPFSIEELAARLRALARRRAGEQFARYRVSNLVLDPATRVIRRGERKIDLTSREFALLECLMRSPNRVFTRTQLSQQVWEMGCEALAAQKPVGIVDRRLVDFRVGDFWDRIGLVNFAKPNRRLSGNRCTTAQAKLGSR